MNQLATIQTALQSQDVTNRLITALDLNPQDEAAQREAFKYASSVMAEVKRSAGQEYGDLTKCIPDSIVQSMIDAAQFKIQIDGRKLAHMESRYDKAKNGNVATLQIDTNGLVAKIKEFYPDASFVITPVYKGDTVTIKGSDNQKSYTYESKNPFGAIGDLSGIIVSISYADVRDVHNASIEDLKTIQSKSKSKAWTDFPLERYKTAALKRACKWHFRQNTVVQAIVDYDNKNYSLSEQPADPVRPSIVDNINAAVMSQTIDHIEDEIDIQGLILSGDSASEQGWPKYKEWASTLSEKERDLLRDRHDNWSKKSKEISLASMTTTTEDEDKPAL